MTAPSVALPANIVIVTRPQAQTYAADSAGPMPGAPLRMPAICAVRRVRRSCETALATDRKVTMSATTSVRSRYGVNAAVMVVDDRALSPVPSRNAILSSFRGHLARRWTERSSQDDRASLRQAMHREDDTSRATGTAPCVRRGGRSVTLTEWNLLTTSTW